MRARNALLLCSLLAAAPSWAQDPDDPLADLVEQERIRAIVETAFNGIDEARLKYDDDTAFVEAYTDLAWKLGNEDPGVVPLLANEAMQGDPRTFYLAVYGLSFQATPEAISALYAAIERAEADEGDFAEIRKAQLIRALAAAGDTRALIVADEGRHHVGDRGMYRAMSTLEVAATLTVPESIEILNKELKEPGLPTPEERIRTLYALRAVRRIGDASSLPVLLRWLGEDSSLARLEAVQGLGFMKDPKSTEALFAALNHEHPTVPGLAAESLALQLPRGQFDRVLEALDEATDIRVRTPLYRILVELDPEAAIPVLKRNAASPSANERLAICQAASRIDSPEILDLLIQHVADPSVQSGICALRALARFDGTRARRVLVRAVDSPRWPLALTASRLVDQLDLREAADTIRHRLAKRELPVLLRDTTDRLHAERFVELLVALEDQEVVPILEAALESHRKITPLVRKLEAGLVALRAARDAGDDLQKWESLANGEDPELRKLAFRHLGRGLHGDADAEILGRALSRAELPDAIRILERLGRIDSDVSRDVVERVLTSPEYDRPELYAFRDMAAWSARRLGGKRMKAALLHSIESRLGRDVRPLIYYAQLAGAESAPLIRRLLPVRMRFNTVYRGNEYDVLRELLVLLDDGRPLDDLDVPPNQIEFF